MKLPSILAAKPRTAEQCRAEIARLEAERTTAVEQLASMAGERLELLGDDSVPVERLLDHDARAAQLAIRRDRAVVQAERLDVELKAAEVREEGERRAKLYAAGQKAERDRLRLMETEYLRTARELVAIVDRAHALTATIEAANRDRPDGAERLGPGEPSNAVQHVPGHYRQLPAFTERFKRSNGERVARGESYAGETYTEEVPQAAVWIHPVQGRAHTPILAGLVVPDLSGRNLFPELGEAQR